MKKIMITDEELDRRLAAMPDDVASVYEGAETARFLFALGKSHDLTDEKIAGIARAVGYVLLGFIQTDEFPTYMLEVIGDQARADTIVREISQKVFLPVRASLLKLLMHPASSLSKPPTLPPPPHPTAPPPPPKPIVLQPLAPQARPIEGARDQALGTGVAETRRVPLSPPQLPGIMNQESPNQSRFQRDATGQARIMERTPSPLPRPAAPTLPLPRPAPPVPSKPVLRPTPAPPAFVKTSTEAEADLTLERMLAELPPELRSAVRPIPLERVIYALGREHHLTIEEIGRLAEGVLEFIAGKTHREDLLATLTRLTGGDRAKAAAASDELNAKVFGPIREAMKRATAPPPPPPPKPPASPAPPTAKKLEPLIIYPLSMARPPAAGITNLESPSQDTLGTGQAKSMGQETPGAAPPVASPSTPLGASRAEPPVVSRVEPPPTLPVYEEARDKGEPPKPSPDEHLRQDPYREPME